MRRRYTDVSGVHCFCYPTGADEKLDKHNAIAGARAREAVNIMLANPVDHCLADNTPYDRKSNRRRAALSIPKYVLSYRGCDASQF